jgi:hypothetical protein
MYQRVRRNFHQVLSFSTPADSGKMPGATPLAPVVGVASGGSAASTAGMNTVAGGRTHIVRP